MENEREDRSSLYIYRERSSEQINCEKFTGGKMKMHLKNNNSQAEDSFKVTGLCQAQGVV